MSGGECLERFVNRRHTAPSVLAAVWPPREGLEVAILEPPLSGSAQVAASDSLARGEGPRLATIHPYPSPLPTGRGSIAISTQYYRGSP